MIGPPIKSQIPTVKRLCKSSHKRSICAKVKNFNEPWLRRQGEADAFSQLTERPPDGKRLLMFLGRLASAYDCPAGG